MPRLHAAAAFLLAASNIAPAVTTDRIPNGSRYQHIQLPVRFEPNFGQAPAGIHTVARAGQLTALLGGRDNVFLLPSAPPPNRERRMRMLQRLDPERTGALVVHQHFTGAQSTAAKFRQPLGSVSNYLRGKDRARWITAVPHYARAEFAALYEGVALAYYAAGGGAGAQLEYDLVVAPHADPAQIAMQFDGTQTVMIDNAGRLVLETPSGQLVHGAPEAYQMDGKRRVPVRAAYRVAANRVSFALGEYDRDKPLVIDPVITFSSYWGGTGTDYFLSVRTDASGALYAGGDSDSTDVPLVQSFTTDQPGFDMSIIKVAASGSLVFSTFVGGSSTDTMSGIAVDASGAVYGTGGSSSPNFPVLNALQTYPGFGASVLFKLGAAGNTLSYSTFLHGGGAITAAAEVQVDASGSAYVAGITSAAAFPTLGAFQAAHGNAGNPFFFDAFITKFASAGNTLVYSTLIGGSGNDVTWDMALDPSGAVTVTGQTNSGNYPTRNAAQGARNGVEYDAFVSRLNPQGNDLIYSTYLGGGGIDIGRAVTCDATGAAYVGGSTESPDYPVFQAFQTNLPASFDAVVTKLSPAGALVYSTYLGGTAGGYAEGIAVDSAGSAYVIGTTFSSDFPLVDPIPFSAPPGAFLTKFNAAGSQLLFSTYLPLTQSDIALDAAGTIYLSGATGDGTLATVNGLQPFRGLSEMLVMRISQGRFDKEACKNGGWQNLTRADGSTFKNQGDCIQYANTGK